MPKPLRHPGCSPLPPLIATAAILNADFGEMSA